ncbi:MAG: glycosyltransferase family 4 protein [Anaerotignaceae bacterium]
MIKVLNIISDSNIGGAGRCILNFLKYCNKEKFEIVVIVPKNSLLIPEIKKLNTKVIECDGIAEKSFSKEGVKAIEDIIKTEKPTIVHTHGNLSGRIAAKKCKVKIIYTRHSVFPVSKKIKLLKPVNKFLNEYLSNEIIAVAEAAKDNLTEGGINGKKVKVILNGVEAVTPSTPLEMEETKKKFNIEKNDFVIGIMARMEPYKGHKYLIEAAEILKKKHKNFKVLIVGTGDYTPTLQAYVKEKNLTDTVIFTGFIKDVRHVLSIMDLQANASYGTEATSLALLEGMSLGIPAVVSNYGGNPGVITHGENGYIFKLQDSEDMAKYMEVLINDQEKYKYMQKRSLEIFKEKFTAEIYTRNIENVYSDVAQGRCR